MHVDDLLSPVDLRDIGAPPLSDQEAMAIACVPVVSDGVGCRELVMDGENGFLFQPGDVQGLAQKILQTLVDPLLGIRARKTIQEDSDIREYVLRYVELYEGTPMRWCRL
jgi:glycosyltransferase involved in cell wall biosynthesis